MTNVAFLSVENTAQDTGSATFTMQGLMTRQDASRLPLAARDTGPCGQHSIALRGPLL